MNEHAKTAETKEHLLAPLAEPRICLGLVPVVQI